MRRVGKAGYPGPKGKVTVEKRERIRRKQESRKAFSFMDRSDRECRQRLFLLNNAAHRLSLGSPVGYSNEVPN